MTNFVFFSSFTAENGMTKVDIPEGITEDLQSMQLRNPPLDGMGGDQDDSTPRPFNSEDEKRAMQDSV